MARNGTRGAVALDHETALSYAEAQAAAFGIAAPRTVEFDKSRAKADLKKKD